MFKKCGACGKIWDTIDAFIQDSRVKVLWLQVIPGIPDANCIIFEHRDCGSTVSVLTPKLRHLLGTDFAYKEDFYNSEECSKRCNTRETMAACKKPCVNARDRELVQLLISLK